MSISPHDRLPVETREDESELYEAQGELEFIREAGDLLKDKTQEWLVESGVGLRLTPEQRDIFVSRAATIIGEAMAEHGAHFFDPDILHNVMESISPTLGIERRQRNREAFVDEVTGLPNARALNRALPAAEEDKNVAVVFIDVNNFGEINKKISDKAGDDMLRYTAQHLKEVAERVLGTSERVFRKGGDEFVILAPEGQAEELRQTIVSEFGMLGRPPLPEGTEMRGGTHHTKQHGRVGFVKVDNLKISLSAGVGREGIEEERLKKDIADNEAQRLKWSLKNINRKREIARKAFRIPPDVIKRPIE